ncbi:hypothetical protein GCM10022280_27700 [Sphingomonas swuensis]|uniref:DNA-directed DNA polymerase n=2 Tax=Sphingomonas swuensis TaxID=977800 RepID=A0ABP7TEW6_9SPHN
MCQTQRRGPSPCGYCEACQTFDRRLNPNFNERSGPELTVEQAREVMSQTSGSHMFAARHVIFIDEAQSLKDGPINALLGPMEDERAERTLIFTLIDPGDLPEPLRTRCQEVQLAAPTLSDKLTFLSRITTTEGVSADHLALELIALFRTGFRGLARDMQAVAEIAAGSRVDLNLVRSTVLRDRAERVVDYLKAVCRSDWAGQESSLQAMNLGSVEKHHAIVDVLMHLKLGFIGPTKQLDRRFELLLPAADCVRLVELFGERARAHGLSLTSLFDEVLEFWAYMPLRLDERSLRIQLVRFQDLMNLERSEPVDGKAIAVAALEAEQGYRSSAAARRKPKHRTVKSGVLDPEEYLSEDQARSLHEAGSFLVQKYGAYLNYRLTLRLPGGDTGKVSAWIGGLDKDLRRGLATWGGVEAERMQRLELHRISIVERDRDGSATGIALFHLPHEVYARAKQALSDGVRQIQTDVPDVDADIIADPLTGDRAVTQHWRFVRGLWRGVDPTIIADGRPLIERLRIPPAHRRPAGRLNGGKRFNMSQSLGGTARREEAIIGLAALSAWGDGAWDWLFSGWEMREHLDRKIEAGRRRQEMAELERLMEAAPDALHRSAINALIRKAIDTRPGPRRRPRSQKLWLDEVEND